MRSELTIKGSWNSCYSSRHNDWKIVLDELSKNPYKFLPLITHEFKLSQGKEAFDIMTNKDTFSIKGMFVND